MTEDIQTGEKNPSRLSAIFTKKRRFPRWISRTICGITIFFWLTYFFFGSQLSTLFFRHSFVKTQAAAAVLSLVPVPLTDTSISRPGTTYSQFGLSFNLPCDLPEKTTYKSAAFFRCKDFKVMLMDPAQQRSIRESMYENKSSPQYIAPLGPEIMGSDYAFWQAILNARPDRISFWINRRDASRAFFLDTLKMTMVYAKTRQINSVETVNVHGFEMLGDDYADIELFDAQDREIKIIFTQKNRNISQPDINVVLQSLHEGDQ